MTAPALQRPAPAAGRVADAALWFGIFGAPVMWSLQLLASYALVAHACYPGELPRATPLDLGRPAVVLGAGAVALAVALGAGAVAWRSWQVTRGAKPGSHGTLLEVGEGRARFMALAGLLVSGVFVLGIVMNLIPVLVAGACG